MILSSGMFFIFNFVARNILTRKTRDIQENKINQEILKKTKNNSRLLKMKIFCEAVFR